MQQLVDKHYHIRGDYSLKSETLTYRTSGLEHVAAAKEARDARREFKVVGYYPELRFFLGIVESVEFVPGEEPCWQVTIRTVQSIQ